MPAVASTNRPGHQRAIRRRPRSEPPRRHRRLRRRPRGRRPGRSPSRQRTRSRVPARRQTTHGATRPHLCAGKSRRDPPRQPRGPRDHLRRYGSRRAIATRISTSIGGRSNCERFRGGPVAANPPDTSGGQLCRPAPTAGTSASEQNPCDRRAVTFDPQSKEIGMLKRHLPVRAGEGVGDHPAEVVYGC